MILVTGATGLTGGMLVRRLSGMGIPVRILVRNMAKAEALAHLPHVEVAEGDMARPETLVAPLQGVERAMLISSSAPDMLEIQSNFIEAARKAGVKHVVKQSGIIPDIHSDFRFARMHGEIEQRLEQSGMAYTQLRGGEFMHSYFRRVPMIVARGELILPMDDARIASLDVSDLAEVAAIVLTSPGHEGKTYPLTGPEALNMTEVAEKLSVVTGKKITYVNIPPEDARAANLANGMPQYTADGLYELFRERRNGKESQVFPDIEKILGRRATSFDEFAQRNVAIFRGQEPAPRV